MKTILSAAAFFLLVTMGFARADEKTPSQKTDDHVQSNVIQDDNASNTQRTMKIQQNQQEEELRRKALLEEIRKLYKVNFL